jgi:chitinase
MRPRQPRVLTAPRNIFFGTGNQPSINLANTCNPSDDAPFPNTALPDCSFLAAGIKACQAKGKLVTMSLGGAAGQYGFTGDDQAKAFADTVWDMLLGGKGKLRPFGDAVLDGIDLDIEGGSPNGYAAFATQLRSHYDADKSKKYILTAAPQCVFPDAYLGETITKVAFDALYVQFCAPSLLARLAQSGR